MGRHSSNEQFRYYQSVIGWFVPWALVGVVAVTAVWIAIGALGRDDLDTRPPGGAAAQGPEEPGSGTSANASESPESPSPSPSPEPEQSQEPKEPDEPADKPKPELITEGVSVQVLNGTSSSAAGRAMTSRLTRLGFDVVVTFPSTPYNDTTVLWSSREAKPAAKALAARFEWRSAPKPANLSPSVDLHVVVGADEA
ncbi:MAG TPA: LytR C-terminal domain-containing protein [Actinomycetota bacterium]|nr:LytR C-terminal domain-containing protein [Actinomycetota bacterium]